MYVNTFFLLHYLVSVRLCTSEWACAYYGTWVAEARGQLGVVSALLPPCGSLEIKLTLSNLILM